MSLLLRTASRPNRRPRAQRSRWVELLERRDLMATVPFGATAEDTGEYMLGDVLVSVVLLESNGTIDANLEDWRPEQIEQVKQTVREGLQWWEDLLDAQNSVHTLNFQLDFTYTDHPIQTGYEPISRRSDDFDLWTQDFFDQAGVTAGGPATSRIRHFNHAQRLAHETHWAFTIFVVNAEHDPDGRFAADGSFSQSFAYAGGRFFVTTSERPASTIAHETAHIFWAMDEYPGGKPYDARRGYYNTQNLNGYDDNPDPSTRVRSLMDSAVSGYALREVSPSALEMIGWKDSDGNGVFDVLDVPHLLQGTGQFDPLARQYRFEGFAQVQTLPNLNSSGSGHDMTLNRIDRIEVRFGQSDWQTALEVDAYQADVRLNVAVPPEVGEIEIRAVDTRSGVSSNIFTDQFVASIDGWQNLADPLDVDADGEVSPLDALLVINQLNAGGSRPLDVSLAPPPFLDVSGDDYLSPLDALMVINQLNEATQRVEPLVQPPVQVSTTKAEGEWPTGPATAAVASARPTMAPPSGDVGGRGGVGNGQKGAGDGLAPRATALGRWRRPATMLTSRMGNRGPEPASSAVRTTANRAEWVDLAIIEMDDTPWIGPWPSGATGASWHSSSSRIDRRS